MLLVFFFFFQIKFTISFEKINNISVSVDIYLLVFEDDFGRNIYIWYLKNKINNNTILDVSLSKKQTRYYMFHLMFISSFLKIIKYIIKYRLSSPKSFHPKYNSQTHHEDMFKSLREERRTLKLKKRKKKGSTENNWRFWEEIVLEMYFYS